MKTTAERAETVKTRFEELSKEKNDIEVELYRLQGEYRLLIAQQEEEASERDTTTDQEAAGE